MSVIKTHELQILIDQECRILRVVDGSNLRRSLIEAGISPYTSITRRANCGGRGLCATCGVQIEKGAPAPLHWHDKLADRFCYPRLSCQITVNNDMIVRILKDKIIWGKRENSAKNGL